MKDFYFMCLSSFILLNINYLIAISKLNFGLIDIAWGLGFILISLTGSVLNEFSSIKENLIFIFVLIWGLRLSIYLATRNIGAPEDYRYQDMRRRWSKSANFQAYFKIYLLQFFLMQIVAIPIFNAHFEKNFNLSVINYFGIFLWLFGFTWETIADYQKSTFKKNPQNKHLLCQVGLWNLSRHPNYFGEAILWWGIGLISFTQEKFWVLIGPAFIHFLLLKVSGIPLIEKRHEKHPDFKDYKQSTPAFIPRITKLFTKA